MGGVTHPLTRQIGGVYFYELTRNPYLRFFLGGGGGGRGGGGVKGGGRVSVRA